MRRFLRPLIPSDANSGQVASKAVSSSSPYDVGGPYDKDVQSLLNCEDLPLSRWYKYVEDDDEGESTRQYCSDDERSDTVVQRRQRKSGKTAR